MVNRDDLKKMVEKAVLDHAEVNLYLLENRKTKQAPLSVYQLNIDQKTIDAVRSIAKGYLATMLALLDSNQLAAIPDYNPDHEQELFQLDSKDVSLFADVYEYWAGGKSPSIYRKKQVKEDKLKAWIFRFETKEAGKIEQILFFQRFQASKMLGSKGVTIFEQGDQFKLIDKSVYHFNLDMDLLYYRDFLVVTSPFAFETIFSFEEYYKSSAVSLANELVRQRIGGPQGYQIKFEDIEAVKSRFSSSSRLSRKLSSVRFNSYYKKINYRKLSAINLKYALNLNLDDRNQEWLIGEDADLQVVARILNDDYELSQLTDNEYIAVGKEVIKPRRKAKTRGK
jgi:hypothetical protein